MEWLPNEVRFLLDSNVVRRIPDRMIPPGNQYPNNLYFNWAAKLPRTPVSLHIGEFVTDYNSPDSFGTDSLGVYDSVAYIINGDTTFRSRAYQERHYFEEHPDCAGCDTVTIGTQTYHAAHHKIDYVKIWDVPADKKISAYPN